MSSSNSKTSLFDDVDDTEDPFAPMEEEGEEGRGTVPAHSTQNAESSTKGGVVLNGPLPGGGGEEGGASAEGTEEEASEDYVVLSLRDVTPRAGASSDGSRPSSTSGESESNVHKRTLTDDQKSNLRQKAGLVGKRIPSPLDMSRPLSSSPPPTSPHHLLTSPTSRERTSSITVKVVKITSRTPSITSRESSVVSPVPSSDGNSNRKRDEEKDKRLEDATAQISQLSHRLQQERSESAALRADKARLEMQVAEIKTVEEVLQEEVRKLKGDNLVLKSDLMDATADKEALEEEVDDFRARFELMEVAWRQRDEEMEDLQKQLAEKLTEMPVEQPVDKPVEKPVEMPVEHPVEQPTEKPVEKLTEQPVEKPADERADEPDGAPTEKPAVKVVVEKAKGSTEKQSPARKGLRKRPNSAESGRVKNRSGVHKENTGSVRDTVRKFSAVAGAGSPEVKRIVRPKQSTRKSSLSENETAKPKEKPATPSTAKGDRPTPIKRKAVPGRPPVPTGKGKHPTPTETPSRHQAGSKVVRKAETKVSEAPPAEKSASKVPPAEKSAPKVPPAEKPTSEVVPPAETSTSTSKVPPAGNSIAAEAPLAENSTSEVPPAQISTSELPPAGGTELPSAQSREPEPPQATMEVAPAQHWILKDTTNTLTAEVKDTAPPAEQDEQKSTAELAIEKLMSSHSPEKEAEEDERKVEEPTTPPVHAVEEPQEKVDGEQGEDVPTALKLITAFEQKKSKPATETPPWKKNLRDELRIKTEEEEDDATKPAEEAEKPHKSAALLPPRPKPVPVPRVTRSKSPEVITKTNEPPKATPRVTETSRAHQKPSEPPKATPKPSEPPKATPKPLEPPKATPKLSEPPKATPKPSEPTKASSQKQVNGEVSPPVAPGNKDEVDGGLLSKPPAKEGSNKSALGDSNEVQLREKSPIRRFHSATDTTAGNNTAPAAGLGIMDKRASWMPKQDKKREDCAVCGRAVYAMERLEADLVVYHKTCFKCSVCRKTLSTGTYAALQGKIYCKVHFKQLFKIKGNYDEGFGREQHKTKWIKKSGQSEC